jgi:hypothetical protein
MPSEGDEIYSGMNVRKKRRNHEDHETGQAGLFLFVLFVVSPDLFCSD